MYSIRLRNTLSSTMRAMSVVDEAQTPDLLHGYALHLRTGTRKASPEIRGVIPSLDIGAERRNGLIDKKSNLFTGRSGRRCAGVQSLPRPARGTSADWDRAIVGCEFPGYGQAPHDDHRQIPSLRVRQGSSLRRHLKPQAREQGGH